MALTFPRDMPTAAVANQSFDIARVDYASGTSNGRLMSVTAGFPLWSMSLTIGEGDADETAEWGAFFDTLRGQQRTFFAGDLTRPFPRAYPDGFDGMMRAGGGAFTGAATSWSINADRDVPSLEGLPAGLEVGPRDYIMWRWSTAGVQRRALARAVESATASAGGVLTVTVEPPLATLVPGSAVADLARPVCVMRQDVKQSGLDPMDALHSATGKLTAFQDLRA